MKKAVSITLVLATLFGMVSALAAGTRSDPLISRSYADGTYRATLSRAIDTSIANSKVVSRTDALGEKLGFAFTPGMEKKSFTAQSKIMLEPGSSFILTDGKATVTYPSGRVINVSTGETVKSGAALTANQRYFCGDKTTATITTTSAATGYLDGYSKSEALAGWITQGGKKYYYKNGVMQTGWLDLDGKRYYFNSNGTMATGWVTLSNTRYYFDVNGVMTEQQSASSGSSSGSSQTTNAGWVKQGNTWYFYDSNGKKKTGWITDGGKKYYLSSNGAMQTGWLKTGGDWYYLGTNGAMQTGWVLLGNQWYFLNSNGKMAVGWLMHSGKWYYLTSSGAMATGWLRLGNIWYFLNSSGAMATGWLRQGIIWYWLKPSGAMAASESLNIGGKIYSFNASGRCLNP